MATRFRNNQPGDDFDREFASRLNLPPAHYSTDLSAAWQIAQRYPNAGCACWIEDDGHTGLRAGATSGWCRFQLQGAQAAHALCRAILMMEHAKKGDVPIWLVTAINGAHPGWRGANRIWRMKTWENVMPGAPGGAMATALHGR